MEKIRIDAHPSVTIAYSEKKNKLLMAVYDAGYPQVSYRFSANNIGGNPSSGDINPCQTLFKEIREEYDPNHEIKYGGKTKFGEKVLFATPEDIALISNNLIERAVSYNDFLVQVKQFPWDKTTKTHNAIFSVFISYIKESTIECAESNIRRCRRLSPEGLTGVFSLDELINDPIKGNLSTAHATAPILNHYFKSNIPYPSEIKAVSLNVLPRSSYHEYLDYFTYSDKIAKDVGVLNE